MFVSQKGVYFADVVKLYQQTASELASSAGWFAALKQHSLRKTKDKIVLTEN